ncbi:hypothetical protein HPULCUR_009863 [Helicostylum pulchrum]|uniref:1-acyl-sn-glycerol-3-phosphate acyltransferase n=1 Tax=Helicostylum pulchrum TaxID=562976 RepID=A0ABP9YBN7_9FUNG
MKLEGLLLNASWSTIAMAVVSFLVIYRHFGGFYYRSAMSMVCLLICSIYGFTISLFLPLIGKTNYINSSVAVLYHTLSCFFTGLKVECEGQENLKKVEGPAIYVCNHQASVDLILLGAVYPNNTTIVAKKALKYYPFLGWFMTLSNAIFLDRKNRDSAVKQAKQAAADIHKKNINVWIFPEGTRGHESEVTLLPFKKGAFYMAVQARVPIIPVVFANYYEFYSAKEKRFNPGTIRCKILPPISTQFIKEESSDVQKFADDCREQMLAALKEITPEYKKSQ